MAREMGAVMTAIIMSGRTGAAFAAQLGTMQVNEEIDALSTFGLSSMDFLVLPRMIALILMMPLLCVYADLICVLGGAVVGVGMLKLSAVQYVNETVNGLSLVDFGVGIFKGAVFGVLIAISGCMRGIQCGRSASAVGLAATSAVVTGIVVIVVTDGIFAVLTNVLGIWWPPRRALPPRVSGPMRPSRILLCAIWTWPTATSLSSAISTSPLIAPTSSSSWGEAAAARARC